MTSQAKEKVFSIVMVLITLTLSLGLLEVGLRVFTPFPIGNQSNKTADPVLGYVMSKNVTGVDIDGFRNLAASKEAGIIAIGDSHTYGYNASPEGSWPAQLSTMLGETVYNMGIGGYGVLEYRELFNRALEKTPKTIIFAVYVPNDIRGVCMTFADNAWWRDWASTHQIDIGACANDKPRKLRKSGISDWFKKETAFGSFLRYQQQKIADNRTIQQGHAKDGIVASSFRSPTFLGWEQIDGGIGSMDVQRPGNALGLDLMERLFGEMALLATQKNIRLMVMVVPSKELVYYKAMSRNQQPVHEKITTLVDNESEMTKRITTILDKHAIPHIEIGKELSLAIERDENIYPAGDDGHPLTAGYRIYAEAAMSMLIANNATISGHLPQESSASARE